MSVYLEMAERLKHDIEVAQEQLANLQAALAALQPLITIDAQVTSVRSLGFRPRKVDPADIANIEEVLSVPVAEAPLAPSKRGPKPGKPRAPRMAPAAIPATGKGFWIGLMGRRKQTLAQIVDKAMDALDLQEDTRPVLTNRLGAWLYPALKAGEVQQAGTRGKLKLYQVA